MNKLYNIKYTYGLGVCNSYDELNRCSGVDFYLVKKPEQIHSHGMSYVGMRKFLEEDGQVMGLEKKVKEKVNRLTLTVLNEGLV